MATILGVKIWDSHVTYKNDTMIRKNSNSQGRKEIHWPDFFIDFLWKSAPRGRGGAVGGLGFSDLKFFLRETGN